MFLAHALSIATTTSTSYSIESNIFIIILQPISISFFEIVNGGVILTGSEITIIPSNEYKLSTMVDFGTKILGTQNATINHISCINLFRLFISFSNKNPGYLSVKNLAIVAVEACSLWVVP